MRTLAILPVKTFSAAKQRLAPDLTSGDRRALAESMFADVLVALRRAHAVDETLVVTADHSAQQIAGGYGAQVLDDIERGHNAAASRGVRQAIQSGIERVVLVPADCPALDPRELDLLLAEPAGARSALIVPDRHGTGTNALVLRPPDVLPPSYGPGSCERHVADAERLGIAGRVVEVASLALDIDTAEDLAALELALRATHGGAAHTRGMLRQLMRSRV